MRINEIIESRPPDHTKDMDGAQEYWRRKNSGLGGAWSAEDHAAYRLYLQASIANIKYKSGAQYKELPADLPISPPGTLKKVYHGTKQELLSKIMKHGLVPQINRYATTPDSFGSGRQETWSKEELTDITAVSTTTNINEAKNYAEWGGSTGDTDHEVPGVVLAFTPLPTDKVKNEGYTGSKTEWSFYNVISPGRLLIVWPKNLKY